MPSISGVSKSFSGRVLFENVSVQINRDDRIVLVGPNGAGKSTLLKILADAIPIQGGERVVGHNVKVGYYAQYRVSRCSTKPAPCWARFCSAVSRSLSRSAC